MAIKVTINGKEEMVEDGMTIARLLGAKNVRPEVVTVELNDEIVHREKYDSVEIKQDDKIEFLYYMGGGKYRFSSFAAPLGLPRWENLLALP